MAGRDLLCLVPASGVFAHGLGGYWFGWWNPGVSYQPFQVLYGGGEQEFVFGPGEPPQPEPGEAEVAFNVSEERLDLLALAPGVHIGLRLH